MKRLVSLVFAFVLLLSFAACGKTVSDAKTAAVETTQQPETKAAPVETEKTEEVVPEIEKDPESLKMYEEFSLLDIDREANSIENGFVQADFIIQNKSDRLTISNFVFEYVVDNGSGTPLDEVFYTDIDGLFVLEPRQKAELRLMEYIGSSLNKDMRIFILSYGYDLNDKHYEVNIPDESVTISDITNQSNVDFDEKNILFFDNLDTPANYCNFVNNGQDIKELEVSVAVYDVKGVLHDIETVNVVEMGADAIPSNGKGSVRLNEIFTQRDGHVVPVRYTYCVGDADSQGYNSFEINLVTKEAIGSTNSMLLENAFEISPDKLKAEIEQYTSTFGMKITDTSFEGYELEERVGSEWLHFKGTTLFGVSGVNTLVRDYDTLILTDFWFSADNQDEATTAYLLQALEAVYGDKYETNNGSFSKELIWEFDDFNVIYNPKYASIHVDSIIK